MGQKFMTDRADKTHMAYQRVIKEKLSTPRYRHALGVAETAQKLAEFWGADPEKAWLAGMLHDYAREYPPEELLEMATNYGLTILREERIHPVVLHAPVGALLVKKELGIQDQEVLDAIAKHTVGGEHLSLLDKIIYLADLIEPNRRWPGVEELRREVYYDLDLALKRALEGTLNLLRKKGQVIHPNSTLMYQQLSLIRK